MFNKMRYSIGEDAGLARTSASNNHTRTFGIDDPFFLGWIEFFQVTSAISAVHGCNLQPPK